MRLAATSRAIGLRLARDLPAPLGSFPLLRAGAMITAGFAHTLVARHGIHAVWVEDELSEGIRPVELLPDEVRREAAVTVARFLETAHRSVATRQSIPGAAVDELGRLVERVIDTLVADADAALALFDLAAADEYTHRHSVDVMALGLLLEREHLRIHGWRDWAGRRRRDGFEQRLTRFGLGLVLHDIGKAAIPPAVLGKPGPLDEEEWALMREHPLLGVAMLPVSSSPIVLAVIRQHHERWDGSGYPAGLAGEAIHGLARVAAVADVFDAVTSHRPYKPAAPPSRGVQVIASGSGTHFDPEVVETFRRVVFPHPVGCEVTLPDGRAGVVSAVDPACPDAPTVRVREGGSIVELTVDLRPLAGATA